MKREILIKVTAIVIAFVILVSLLGGWNAVFSAVGEFIKFIIFLFFVYLIGYAVIKWWKQF